MTLAVLRRRLGREEWIVNALYVFLRNASSGIRDDHANAVAIRGAHLQRSAAGHGIFRVQEQVQEDLLQPARVSLNHRKMLRQVVVHQNSCGLELMLEQVQGIGDNAIQINFSKFRSIRAREVEKIIDDLRCTERLSRDLVEKSALLLVALKLFREYLRVR